MAVESSDPRCGALMIGTFCPPGWAAGDCPEVNDHLGALRVNLGLPRQGRTSAASEAQRARVLDALIEFVQWLDREDFTLGAGWSAAGEGQFAQGQVILTPSNAVLSAVDDQACRIADRHGVAYRIKAGPDGDVPGTRYDLVYFSTDAAGSTVTAAPIDARNLPAGREAFAVAGFHATRVAEFDDTVGFLNKLGTSLRGGRPSKGERLATSETEARYTREGLNQLAQRVQVAEQAIRMADTRMASLDRTVDQRIAEAQRNNLTPAQLDSALAQLYADHDALRAELEAAIEDRARAVDGQAAQLADRIEEVNTLRAQRAAADSVELTALAARITALESGRPTASAVPSLAGFYSDAVSSPITSVEGPGRGAAMRPQFGGRSGGGIRPLPGRSPAQTRPAPARRTAGGLKRPMGPFKGSSNTAFGHKFDAWKGGGMSRFNSTGWKKGSRKPTGRKYKPTGSMFGGRPRVPTRQPIPRDYPIPTPYPIPGGGGGMAQSDTQGWGGAGQDFSDYFNDGQDWDGDGQGDANAEWLDEGEGEGEEGSYTLLDMALADGEIDEDEYALLLEAGLDPHVLSQIAEAAFLDNLTAQYKGLPPGWKPGATQHSFIKADGTPHNFGGGDYNNGLPTSGGMFEVGGAPGVGAYVTTSEGDPHEAFIDTIEEESGIDFDTVEDDGIDFDDEFAEELAEEIPWGVAPPTEDIPRPKPFSGNMGWMEFPGS